MKFLKILLVLLLIFFPFGQLTKIPLGIPGVSLYLPDLVVSLLLFLWIFFQLLKRKSFLRPPLTLPILVFICVALFSLLVNSWRLNLSEFLISFLYLLRWSVYSGVYFVVYEMSRYTLHATRYTLLKLLTLAGIVAGIFGLLQYFLYPNLRNLYYLGWDPHYKRVFGTFFDPGFLGIILILTLILLLCLKIFKQPSRIFFGILVYLALALTYSRSSYLALVAALIVLAWFKKSPKFLLIPLFLLVFTVGLLPRPAGEGVRLERHSTVLARFENWRQTLKIIRDHPLFGVGFNSLRFIKRDNGFLSKDWQEVHSGAGADSSLLFIWATTGFLGLIVYLWMWWRIVKLSLPPRRSPFGPPSEVSSVKALPLCIIASTAVLFTHSLFLNSLFYPWIMIWMWVLLGASHALFSP